MNVYESIPERVEAVQWRGFYTTAVRTFKAPLHSTYRKGSIFDEIDLFLLAGADGAQGYVPVPVGHWIVRAAGDLSDHWPVEDEHFRNTYRQADDTSEGNA